MANTGKIICIFFGKNISQVISCILIHKAGLDLSIRDDTKNIDNRTRSWETTLASMKTE